MEEVWDTINNLNVSLKSLNARMKAQYISVSKELDDLDRENKMFLTIFGIWNIFLTVILLVHMIGEVLF